MPTLCVCSPVILDPADPTGILGQGKNWELMAQAAAMYCRSLRFLENVQPWDVQVRLPELVSITVPHPCLCCLCPLSCPCSQPGP